MSTPDTSDCPYRSTPPPPVDLSEVPAPGTAGPEPLPLPDQPVGGERMGECDTVLPTDAPPVPDGITATSWLVADLDTGHVLAAKDPHGRHRPASTIKLLTALVADERLPPDRVVVASQADADTEGSSAGVGPGGQYTVAQLLAGLLLVSGNDTAHALAAELGGVPVTLAAMNAQAQALGALDTRAASVSGLDAPGMSTSAYDLGLLMREVLDRPRVAALLRTPQIDFPGYGGRPGFVLANDSRLLAAYPGFLGGKAGFTDDARHTYVGAAERDGRRLVVALMRGEQRPVPMWEQAARLLDYGFRLPPGKSVGRLADATPTRSTTTITPTTPVPAPSAREASAPPPEPGPGSLVVLGWLLAGTGVVVAALVGVLLRQRED